MRKAILGLLMGGLLAVATPAMAQVRGPIPGSQDPLALITSGFVIPYVGANANSASLLEVYTPVGGADIHAFFFTPTCESPGESIAVPMTANDVELIRVDDISAGQAASGLLTVAASDPTGFFLRPLGAPVHARMLWVNFATTRIRVFDPIAISTVDNDRASGGGTPQFPTGGGVPRTSIDRPAALAEANTGVWSPLRTANTFFAPPQVGGVSTTIIFVCPNQNIASPLTGPPGAATTFPTRTVSARTPGLVFGTDFFPALVAGFDATTGAPLPANTPLGTPTPILVRVYDDEEVLLRDTVTSCTCLQARPVTEISNVYADTRAAPFGTYTEMIGSSIPSVPGTTVCSTTEVVPLQNPQPAPPAAPIPNAGNPCPFQFNPVTGVATAQFRAVTTGAVAGQGPFAFMSYRLISAPPWEVFNRNFGACSGDIDGSIACDNPALRNGR